MIKVFISQPMNGRTQDEILREREAIEKIIKVMLGDKIYFIDSFIRNAKDVNALFYLGHSLMSLSKADIAVFAPGWKYSRGCKIEFQCCNDYNIKTIQMEVDDLKGE